MMIKALPHFGLAVIPLNSKDPENNHRLLSAFSHADLPARILAVSQDQGIALIPYRVFSDTRPSSVEKGIELRNKSTGLKNLIIIPNNSNSVNVTNEAVVRIAGARGLLLLPHQERDEFQARRVAQELKGHSFSPQPGFIAYLKQRMDSWPPQKPSFIRYPVQRIIAVLTRHREN